MEHMSESIAKTSFAFTTPDVYAAAHDLLHWAQRFGHVIERENRVATTGPRASATVKFYIEHALDKFTHIHVSFDMSGDMATSTLAVAAEATLECTLPTRRGLATTTFRDVYLARLWPAHLRLARDISKEILEAARTRLTAPTIQVK